TRYYTPPPNNTLGDQLLKAKTLGIIVCIHGFRNGAVSDFEGSNREDHAPGTPSSLNLRRRRGTNLFRSIITAKKHERKQAGWASSVVADKQQKKESISMFTRALAPALRSCTLATVPRTCRCTQTRQNNLTRLPRLDLQHNTRPECPSRATRAS
ncbi:unnamed protein product, partial [Ectocarpus sp. 6 AP-2014]